MAGKTKMAAASLEAGKASGKHAQLSLTGLERMAKAHRALAKKWKEKPVLYPGSTEYMIFRTASEVHDECATVLQMEAEELRGQP